MRIDVLETASSYVMICELPGVLKEEVEALVDGQTVEIVARKNKSSEETSDYYHLHERSFGRIVRSVTFPADANLDEINLNMSLNGILKLECSKHVGEKGARKLEI